VAPEITSAPTPEQRLLAPAQVAHILGLDRVTRDGARAVREMARRGELRAVRVGKWTMIDAASVDRFIDPTKGHA